MSKRRKAGEWVWLKPNVGFVGDSYKRRAEIQPEEPEPCWDRNSERCGDKDCMEWPTLFTAPDSITGKRYVLCHVTECQMFDERQE